MRAAYHKMRQVGNQDRPWLQPAAGRARLGEGVRYRKAQWAVLRAQTPATQDTHQIYAVVSR